MNFISKNSTTSIVLRRWRKKLWLEFGSDPSQWWDCKSEKVNKFSTCLMGGAKAILFVILWFNILQITCCDLFGGGIMGL
jgi:hypothetical protein